ncbi:hypothetical protein ACSX1A_05520 [Pontibacter sp. MBLB2868]|uniref:hypothetical protein n=1 Tax=Pontibacter sp. MBLB2868 TaxID=3451555 RepID=UPI003F754EEA
MRLTGNIQQIKNKRDDNNSEIILQVDQIEYITHKKDGRFYQPFDFVDELDTPIIITGDRLARITGKHLEEGEHEFAVYDKTPEGYELNENKKLHLTTTYDFDTDLTILRFIDYTVTVSNEEFQQIKRDRSEANKAKKSKARKNK